jgi:hypothetical protein
MSAIVTVNTTVPREDIAVDRAPLGLAGTAAAPPLPLVAVTALYMANTTVNPLVVEAILGMLVVVEAMSTASAARLDADAALLRLLAMIPTCPLRVLSLLNGTIPLVKTT